MKKHVAHCADRHRRSGAQTSGTEVERSRTGRRSVRAQWRIFREGYYYPRGALFPNRTETSINRQKFWELSKSHFPFIVPF